jgi:hypothetical protein
MMNKSGDFVDLELDGDGAETNRKMINEVNVIKVCTLIISGMTCANC